MGDGEGEFFAGAGEDDEAEVDGKYVAADGIGVDGRAAVEEDKVAKGNELGVGGCYLFYDTADVCIDFLVVDVVVAGDGFGDAGSALLPKFLQLSLGVAFFEGVGADPGFFQGVALRLVIQV